MKEKKSYKPIEDEVLLKGVGHCDYTVKTEDGEDILPPGYYMELEIGDEEVIVPIDSQTYNSISNILEILPVQFEEALHAKSAS